MSVTLGRVTVSLMSPSVPVTWDYFVLCVTITDANVDLTAKKSDITTFRGAFESVMRQHYPSMVGRIAIRLISCPSVCTEGLGILSR